MSSLTLARLLLSVSAAACALAGWVALRVPVRERLRGARARLRGQLAFLGAPDLSLLLLCAQLGLSLLSLLCIPLAQYWLAGLALLPVLSLGPWLELLRARRVAELELSVPTWLGSLASVLRATPAVGDALSYSSGLCAGALRYELSRCVLEHRLGAALEAALEAMTVRVGSRTLRTAVAVLRVGIRSGGDVSRILEGAAASLRELARLEGVLRTRTAEGRAQAFVVALVPFPTVAMITYEDPAFLAPLWSSLQGRVLVGVAAALWLASLALARRILRVDI